MESVRIVLSRVLEAYDFTEGQLPASYRTDDTVVAVYLKREDVEAVRAWLTHTNSYEVKREPVLGDPGGSGPEPAPDAGAI